MFAKKASDIIKVIASASGNASQTPVILKRYASKNTLAKITTNPRIIDITKAKPFNSVGGKFFYMLTVENICNRGCKNIYYCNNYSGKAKAGDGAECDDFFKVFFIPFCIVFADKGL